MGQFDTAAWDDEQYQHDAEAAASKLTTVANPARFIAAAQSIFGSRS